MSQHTNDIFKKNLSAQLLRQRGDRSQAEFARFLGMPSQQTYQRYEDGKVMPPADVLHTIASKLGVTSAVLLGQPELSAHDIRGALSNSPPPLPSAEDCIQHLQLFLKRCQQDASKIGWTWEELHIHFPLTKWRSSTSPSSKPDAATEDVLDAVEDPGPRRRSKP